jgi:hypothetical protein
MTFDTSNTSPQIIQMKTGNPKHAASALPPAGPSNQNPSREPKSAESNKKNALKDSSSKLSAPRVREAPMTQSPVSAPPPSLPHKKGETVVKPAEIPAQMKAVIPEPINKTPNEVTSAKQSPSIKNTNPQALLSYASIPEYSSSNRFNIQAIAWDETPEDRLVVINNSILREGGLIDGVTVSQIGKNEILINDDGQQWKIVFIRP